MTKFTLAGNAEHDELCTLPGDENPKRPSMRRFMRNCLGLLTPETFTLLVGYGAYHWGSVILSAHSTTYYANTGTEVVKVAPSLISLSSNWAYFMLAMAAANVLVCLHSIMSVRRPHRMIYFVTATDAFMYAYVSVALCQAGVPVNLYKVFVINTAFSVLFCLIAQARQRAEIERECEPKPDGLQVEKLADYVGDSENPPVSLLHLIAAYREARDTGQVMA